ncbi:hypothetical protein JVU11DRAFT_8501 [Chiua virens]|nr:hypothetical protein JVU11DRAFT_8501 [Chiua virens]
MPTEWTTREQKAFLIEELPAFKKIGGRRYALQWPDLYNHWFQKWPECPLALPNVPVDATLTQEQGDILAKAIERRQAQLRHWLQWRSGRYTNRAANNKTMKIIDHLVKPKTRAKRPWETYSKIYYSTRIRESYDNELPEIKEEIRKIMAEHKKAKKKESQAGTDAGNGDDDDDDDDPLSRRTYIEQCGPALQHILEHFSSQTGGWHFSVLMGGPDPLDTTGNLITSLHVGKTNDGRDFSHVYTDFDTVVVAGYGEYLGKALNNTSSPPMRLPSANNGVDGDGIDGGDRIDGDNEMGDGEEKDNQGRDDDDDATHPASSAVSVVSPTTHFASSPDSVPMDPSILAGFASTIPELALYSGYLDATQNTTASSTDVTQFIQPDPFSGYFSAMLNNPSLESILNDHWPGASAGTGIGADQPVTYSNQGLIFNDTHGAQIPGYLATHMSMSGFVTTPIEPSHPLSPLHPSSAPNPPQIGCLPLTQDAVADGTPVSPGRLKRKSMPSQRAQRDNAIGESFAKENHVLPTEINGLKNAKVKQGKKSSQHPSDHRLPKKRSMRKSKQPANAVENDADSAPPKNK